MRHVTALLLAAPLLACGARSALESGSSGGGGLGGAASTTAGTGGGAAGGGGSAPEPPCLLTQDEEPVEALRFDTRHATSPGVAALSEDSVALQALASSGDSGHPEVFVGAWRFGAAGLASLTQIQPTTLLGIESHSYAAMVRSRDGADLAMSWYSDPGQVGRTAFRRLDVASWSPAAPVDLSLSGGSPLALAAGAGAGDFGVGHAGEGYAAAWRESAQTGMGSAARPVVAVLDEAGSIALGPHPVGPLLIGGGVSVDMQWTGSHYVLAALFGDCGGADCPEGIAVYRFLPATGDVVDDSTVELVWSRPLDAAGRRPKLGVYDGRLWLAYFEGPEDGPVSLVVERLLPSGELDGEPVIVEEGIEPLSTPRMVAAPFGLVIGWPTEGDIDLPEDEPGRSRYELRHLGADGQLASPPASFALTRFVSSGVGALAAVGEPRGVAITWGARGQTTPFDTAYLGFLPCAD